MRSFRIIVAVVGVAALFLTFGYQVQPRGFSPPAITLAIFAAATTFLVAEWLERPKF